MSTPPLFKWRHFQADIILLNVRWYCRYALSYRDLEEMMGRGVEVDHSTINRWVLKYAPQLDKRIRPYLCVTNDSWRVDETYVKVRCEWKYLYRAVDSAGNTLDFIMKCEAGQQSCGALFPQSIEKATHTQSPRVITVDKNAAYPKAIETLKGDKTLSETTQMRQKKYLNNIVEQDYRAIKRLTNAGIGNKIVQHGAKNIKRV